MDFRKLEKLLKRNGWYLVRVSGSHHQYQNAQHGGTATIPYHAGKTLGLNVIKSIEKQTGLSLR